MAAKIQFFTNKLNFYGIQRTGFIIYYSTFIL